MWAAFQFGAQEQSINDQALFPIHNSQVDQEGQGFRLDSFYLQLSPSLRQIQSPQISFSCEGVSLAARCNSFFTASCQLTDLTFKSKESDTP